MTKKIIASVALLLSTSAFAGKVRIRAREHFEWTTITVDSRSSDYRGFNNTINVWWEEPYRYSAGLSFSPVLANISSDDANPVRGRDITPIHLGVEGKIFYPERLGRFYTRPGLSYTSLRTSGVDPQGVSLYLGLGYELPIKSFGLSFEFAYRESFLSEDTRISSMTPSIGLHYYGF